MSEPRFPYSIHIHEPPVANEPALLVRNLSGRYPEENAPAVTGLNLSIPVGSSIALVGPNGAGKSTLIKLVAGLLPIQSGEVRTFGRPVGNCRHRVAYLAQRSGIDWKFPVNVRELVTGGRYVHRGWFGRLTKEDRQLVDAALERLGIAHLAERQIGDLSGGQQQRALLARALAQDADLLLLDEPLNAVDADTREVVARTLHELKIQGKTAVIATHDLGRLESDYDGALYLCEGHEVEPPPGAFVGIDVTNLERTNSLRAVVPQTVEKLHA